MANDRKRAAVRAANLGLRFLLEIGALVGLAWWGFGVSVVLGIAAPLAAAVVWWLFVAPKARYPVRLTIRAPIEIAVFAAGALGFWAAGQHGIAIVFACAVAVSEVLLYGFGAG